MAGMAAIIATAERTEQACELRLSSYYRGRGVPSVHRPGTLSGYFDHLLPGLPLFNIPYVVRLVGILNVAVLEQSFNEIQTP